MQTTSSKLVATFRPENRAFIKLYESALSCCNYSCLKYLFCGKPNCCLLGDRFASFCISLLCFSVELSYSYTLCTGGHFEPAPSQLVLPQFWMFSLCLAGRALRKMVAIQENHSSFRQGLKLLGVIITLKTSFSLKRPAFVNLEVFLSKHVHMPTLYFTVLLITSVGLDYQDCHQNKMAAPLDILRF